MPNYRKEISEILSVSQKRTKVVLLRRAMIESGIVYQCDSCKLKEWQGKEIVIEVHHIDGNNLNNKLDNLQFLCPNCHSQTDNFRVKNTIYSPKPKKLSYCSCGSVKSKISGACPKCFGLSQRRAVRPSKEELYKLIWEKPVTHLANELNISDKAIERWCKAYGIAKPPRGYWSKNKNNG